MFYLLDGDTLPVLQTQLADSYGYVDITSGQPWFFWRLRGRPSGSGLFSGQGTTVGNSVSGLVQYTWTGGIQAGVYNGRWKIYFSGVNKWESFPNDSYLMFEITNNL